MRSTQITGQGIRSFDDERDILWAPARSAAVIADMLLWPTKDTSKWLVQKQQPSAGIHDKQPQTDSRWNIVYLGHRRRREGKELVDTNTGRATTSPILQLDLWSFGEISYWLGLGHLGNKMSDLIGADTFSRTVDWRICPETDQGAFYTLCLEARQNPYSTSLALLCLATSRQKHSALISFSCSPFDSEAGTWPPLPLPSSR